MTDAPIDAPTHVTLIADDGSEVVVAGRVDDATISVDLSACAAALGWSAEPHGLCRDDVCIPLPPELRDDDLVDVRALGGLLGAPVAADGIGAVAIGAAATMHARVLASDEAPDFTLPSLAGGDFRLGSLRGRKCLLVAWASW